MTTVAETNTNVRDTWPDRVRRAADLAAIDAPSRALLLFDAALLRAPVNTRSADSQHQSPSTIASPRDSHSVVR